MLSSTLSFLCNPQPVVVRPPPRGPRHQRALPPNPPHTHSAHGSYDAPPPHGCCGHRASQYSEYELATYPPHYHQHHHLHHHHHGEQRGGEYWRYERQEPAVLVEHLPHHYAAALPQHAAFVIGGGGDDERYHELAYVDQVQRSLALLKENVRKLSAGPGDGVSKKHHLAAAAAHATVVIEAMAAGKQLRHDDRDHLPVATLFKTIRKQRAQPRYLCAECGSASTTQWRNSPNGMKICNPCGMRLWRSRKRKENAAAANNNDSSSGNDNDNKKQECEQAQPAEDEKDSSYDASRGRSNIYNLLN